MLIRFWCHTCNEFTPHDINRVCTTCKSINNEYNIADIPGEKLIAQRARYSAWIKAKRRGEFASILNMFSPTLLGYTSSFSSNPEHSDMIETDAGQLTIDNEQEQIDNEIREQVKIAKEKLKLEYTEYKNLRRNDICKCGSGKKYKNCCINKFQQF